MLARWSPSPTHNRSVPRGSTPQKASRGLSLPEVLVVMALLASLLVIVSTLFLRGRGAVRLATERLETSGRARRAMDALTPYVTSAIHDVKPPLEVRDTTPDQLGDACSLLVSTREAFLSPTYRPRQPYLPNPLVPAWRYQISFRPATRELVVEQLRPTATGEQVDPDVPARLLGRDLDGCGFRQLSPGSVEVTLRARSEHDDERRPEGATRSLLKALLAAPGVR
jgi:prepilin-type N-terminal cleavage/methylation domain-containing protein